MFKTITANELKVGDVIEWESSGYYDLVEKITDNKIGGINVHTNNDTSTMAFLPNELLKLWIR